MMKRLASLDVLRALAILLMIQVHFVEYLSVWEWPWKILTIFSLHFGRLPAPIFSFLVGLSLNLWMRNKKTSGWTEGQIGKSVQRRGLFLFFGGLVYTVLVWLPKEVFFWDILPFLGASTLILYLLRKWPTGKLVILALFIMVISPPLRTWTHYSSHWKGGWYYYAFTMSDVLLGFLLHGFFPILPWLVFPVIGFATGKYLISDDNGNVNAGKPILGIGLSFACLAGLLICSANLVPASLKGYFGATHFYPATTSFVATMVGLGCLGLWLLNRRIDNTAFSQGVMGSFFRRYSSFALTTYLVHFALMLWPMYLIAALQQQDDPRCYLYKVVSPPIGLLLAVLFIALFYRILIPWEKNRKYSFEGLLRWLSEP